MESDRNLWIFIVVLVGISGFFAGNYWSMLRTNTALIESLDAQIGMIQDEGDFLLNRDLQLLEEIAELRNAIQDLEEWMEKEQIEQTLEFEDYVNDVFNERLQWVNNRVDSLWTQISDIRSDVRELKRLYCDCDCVEIDDRYEGSGFGLGPYWCEWCECYCKNCTCPYCAP